MKLTRDVLQNPLFEHYELPNFGITQLREKTAQTPTWVHFGAGNIFRAFPARIYQKLLNQRLVDTGIIVVESFDFEVVENIFHTFDNLSLAVLLKHNGEVEKSVVASVAESLTTNIDNKDFLRLQHIFSSPSLQFVSFTITEKGYALKDISGQYFPFIVRDLENGPEIPVHGMCVLTSLLYRRYISGAYPLTLVSMDNCSHNGDKLKEAVFTVAREWALRGLVKSGFLEYLQNKHNISFPLTMIDKITPRPAESVKNILEQDGLSVLDIIVTEKNTYTAPFVNAEICEYLVIEDNFTNGRPPLEKVGVFFTDRETVNAVETMKVTTCLNPLHTALAVTGCLLGFTSMADTINHPVLRALVERIGYVEGLRVVKSPGIIEPKDFIDAVLGERLPNPYIPDTPQRVASDTSQKVAIRFGETIKAYVASKQCGPKALVGISLAIAAWVRYLLAIDDDGKVFTLSPDPMMDYLQERLKDIHMGDTAPDISELLSNEAIFGINLYTAGIGKTIEDMFTAMLAGPGAVELTLKEWLG